jgi:tRNA (guanine-N7-)-methyltransferase
MGLRVWRRSFIPKAMLDVAQLSPKTIAAEIVPSNYFAPLDFEAVYGTRAPLEVDLGCGDGLFLTATAIANPGRNFLGVERLEGRVRSACRKVIHHGRTNARILRCEISYAACHLLPPASVTVFHLMFPDPWPKRRHAARRLFTRSFLASLDRALKPGGTIRIATDQRDYFAEMERVAAASPAFVTVPDRDKSNAVSTFERRFSRDAIEIHRLMLRKVSEVT